MLLQLRKEFRSGGMAMAGNLPRSSARRQRHRTWLASPKAKKTKARSIAQRQSYRKSARLGKSGESLLQGLHQLLQRLDQRVRRSVLSKRFTEVQRREFERWMLARGGESSAVKAEMPGRVSKVTRKVKARDSKASLAAVFRDKEGIAHVPGLVVHSKLGEQARYSAIVTIGRVRLLTKEHQSLEVARDFRTALVDFKQRMEGVEQADFEDRFRTVLVECLEEHGLEPRAMGLRFCVVMASLWLPRPLVTPPFLAEGQAMDAGLRAWRRLSDARGHVLRRGSVLQVLSPEEIAATWARIRSSYLEAVAEAACIAECSEVKCRKDMEAAAFRLQALEAAQGGRQEKQLERWNRRKMAQEEALQRQESIYEPGAEEARNRYQKILKRVDRLLEVWSRKRRALRCIPL
ncbi:unnamed protein product [Effrenium voratum]|nr:unnamed protein product [Effrenium voratum]